VSFVGHRQSVRLEWCPWCSSFVFAASAGGTVVVVAASVAVSEAADVAEAVSFSVSGWLC
jgi:hypothetical protein